jgi:hypothetical protein
MPDLDSQHTKRNGLKAPSIEISGVLFSFDSNGKQFEG